MRDVQDLPPLAELRSLDPRASQRAWALAFPLLWKMGMKIASMRLAGASREEDRRDAVHTAIIQLNNGLLGVRMDGGDSEAKSFQNVQTTDELRRLFYCIVRARLADILRRERVPMTSLDQNHLAESLPAENSSSNPDLLGLWSLVEKLRPPKPEVFTAHYLEGYSTDEIAERFGMSRNTVVSHFRRGLMSLRKMMNEEEEEKTHA